MVPPGIGRGVWMRADRGGYSGSVAAMGHGVPCSVCGADSWPSPTSRVCLPCHGWERLDLSPFMAAIIAATMRAGRDELLGE